MKRCPKGTVNIQSLLRRPLWAGGWMMILAGSGTSDISAQNVLRRRAEVVVPSTRVANGAEAPADRFGPARTWCPKAVGRLGACAATAPEVRGPSRRRQAERGHSKWVTGLVVGFLGGAAVGAVIGAATDLEDTSPLQKVATGAGVGAVSGAAVGAIVGATIHVGPTIRPGVSPSAPGSPRAILGRGTRYGFHVAVSW